MLSANVSQIKWPRKLLRYVIRTEVYCEGAPLRGASVKVSVLDMKVSSADCLWSQSIEKRYFGTGRYAHCTQSLHSVSASFARHTLSRPEQASGKLRSNDDCKYCHRDRKWWYYRQRAKRFLIILWRSITSTRITDCILRACDRNESETMNTNVDVKRFYVFHS